MTITFLAEANTTTASTLTVLVPPDDFKTGDTLVVGIKSKKPFSHPPVISDSAGNTYVRHEPKLRKGAKPRKFAFTCSGIQQVLMVTATVLDQIPFEMNLYKVDS